LADCIEYPVSYNFAREIIVLDQLTFSLLNFLCHELQEICLPEASLISFLISWKSFLS
jgi:hypothetical protein